MVCEAIKHQRSPTPTHSSQHVLTQREVGFLHLVNEDTDTVRGCYIQMKYMTKPDLLTSPTINKNNGKVNMNAQVIISSSDHWLLASSSFCCWLVVGCTRALTFYLSPRRSDISFGRWETIKYTYNDQRLLCSTKLGFCLD